MTMRSLSELSKKVLEMQKEGTVPSRPTPEQRVQWAFGQTSISNPDVTIEHARAAVQENGGYDDGEP